MLMCVGSEWSRHGRVVDAAVVVVALVVVVVSSLKIVARQVRESLRVALRRSCPAVMIRRDRLFGPKEGLHKPVKIETPPLLQLSLMIPWIIQGDRKSYAMNELLCDNTRQ